MTKLIQPPNFARSVTWHLHIASAADRSHRCIIWLAVPVSDIAGVPRWCRRSSEPVQLWGRHELHHHLWPYANLQIALAQEVRTDLRALLSADQQRSASEDTDHASVCMRDALSLHSLRATMIEMHANAPCAMYVAAG